MTYKTMTIHRPQILISKMFRVIRNGVFSGLNWISVMSVTTSQISSQIQAGPVCVTLPAHKCGRRGPRAWTFTRMWNPAMAAFSRRIPHCRLTDCLPPPPPPHAGAAGYISSIPN